MSPSCVIVAAMAPSARIQTGGHDPAPARRGRRPALQQVPFVGPDGPVEPDRRVGGAAAMGAGLHRMPVHLQCGIDHVDVGDVRRDQRVHRWVVGQRNRCPPPQSPHELAGRGVVGDPDVELVQRHRRRRPCRARCGAASRDRQACRAGARVRGRAARRRTTPWPSSAGARPGASRRGARPRSCRRTPASPCTRRGRRPRRRAGTAGACWSAAGRRRRCGTPRPGSARRIAHRRHAFRPARLRARSMYRRQRPAPRRAA